MWCCWISCIEIQWFNEGVCINVLLICQNFPQSSFSCDSNLSSVEICCRPSLWPAAPAPPGFTRTAPHRGEAGTGQLSAQLRTSAWWEWCQFWLFFQAGPAYRVCSEKSRLQFIFSHSWIFWNSCWFRPRLQDGAAARNGKVFPFAFNRVLCSHRSTIMTENTAVSMPGQ